jgi:hypothetical protein
MGPPGFMDLYGRLEHLDYDLGAILRRLGYTKLPKERAKFHCISSCGAVAARECSSYRIECRGNFEHKKQKMAVIPMLRVEAWV